MSEFQKVEQKCLDAIRAIKTDDKERRLRVMKDVYKKLYNSAKAELVILFQDCERDMENIIFDYIHELQNWNRANLDDAEEEE